MPRPIRADLVSNAICSCHALKLDNAEQEFGTEFVSSNALVTLIPSCPRRILADIEVDGIQMQVEDIDAYQRIHDDNR